MQGTIDETFEYRMKKVVAGVLKNNNMKPKTTDELFDFLEGRGASEFANAVVAEMITWAGEDEWLNSQAG